MKKCIKYFMVAMVLCALMLVSFSYQPKPNIHNATITQLNSVQGIGDKLSMRIYVYVQKNNIQHVSDLQGHVLQLGEKRLNELKKVYK